MSSSADLLGKLKTFGEDLAAELLSEYTEYIASPAGPVASSKEVNDPIWGTIKLQPAEVALLDSPLLQRLRFIRQLGVVHWTYPGAIHTRFEHTLGVLHQVQQLITSINGAGEPGQPAIDDKHASILRLSALLHDVGHGVFSHVSEHALIRADDLRRALGVFTRENRLDKVQLSELMAHYLLGSSAFQALLKTVLAKVPNTARFVSDQEANARAVIELIRNAIIGKAINDQVPLMHELISGPLDGDKLDYFVRDAKMAGIPTVLDISRLTQKIAVEKLSQHDLPQTIAAKVKGGYQSYYLFGLKWSGAAVLDELHLARILLYAKIYRHQKVLAAEAMIEALFDMLAGIPSVETIDLVKLAYRLTDDQLLWTKPKDVCELVGLSENPEALSFVADILKRLRDRRLYVKALAVRATYPNDGWASFEPHVKGLQRLIEDLSNPEKARSFRHGLVHEIEKVVSLVPDVVAPTFDTGLIHASVIVVAKSRLSGGTEIDRTFVFHGGKPVSYRDLSGVNRHAWADAYDFSTAPALIFCPRELAPAVYIAVEKLVREGYDVLLPASALELSKQEALKVLNLKRSLTLKGYYTGAPFDLRPKSDRLRQADIGGFLDRTFAKLDMIDEPPTAEGTRRQKDLRSRIEYWISQFETEDHIECAMQVLDKLRVISRDDTKNALRAFVQRHPDFAGATVLLLGALKDSSAIQGYLSQDVADVFPRVMTVEEAAAKNIDTPVVFLDDFIGSGNQVRDMLGHWFDQGNLKTAELGEQRDLFGEAERKFLRERKIGFVFVAGWDIGIQAAQDACRDLSLDAQVFAYMTDKDIPFAFDGSTIEARDSEVLDSFKNKCSSIGEQMLLADGKTTEIAAERALGYGNRGMLLVSRYNVPTQVLTCIWRSGQTQEFEWHSLINRRTKN